MEQNILLSVIVPIYNREDYLRRCVESIIQQTYRNLQILLIDDGSTDSSGLICDEYKEQDNRIIVIHQKNKGVVVARKVGLTFATGEYVAFVDSDDWIDVNMYSILLTKALETQADRIFCNFYYANGTKNIEKKLLFDSSPSQMLNWLLAYKNPVVIWNSLFKNANAKMSLMGCIDSATLGEDLLINVISLSLNPQLAVVTKPLYYYNCTVHDSLVNKDNIIYEARENINAVYEFLVDKGTIKDYLPTMFFTPLRVKISLLNEGKIDEAIALFPHVNKVKEFYTFLSMNIRWVYWALFNWGKFGRLIYTTYIYTKQFVKQRPHHI